MVGQLLRWTRLEGLKLMPRCPLALGCKARLPQRCKLASVDAHASQQMLYLAYIPAAFAVVHELFARDAHCLCCCTLYTACRTLRTHPGKVLYTIAQALY